MKSSIDSDWDIIRLWLISEMLTATFIRLSGWAKRMLAVVLDFGEPRKSVALEWQKDLLRFLISPYGSNDFFCPLGQGDIKCQHVYSYQDYSLPKL